MAIVLYGGYYAAQFLVSVVGYRVATTLVLATAGRSLAHMAVKSIGGPITYLPNNVILTAIDKVIPSPTVILGTDFQTQCVVKVTCVVLDRIKKTSKSILIMIKDSPLIGSIWNTYKRWRAMEEQKVKINSTSDDPSPSLLSYIVEDYHPTKHQQSHQYSKEEKNIGFSHTKPPGTVVLEMNADDVNSIFKNFEGETQVMTTEQFQHFLKQESQDNPNLYHETMELVSKEAGWVEHTIEGGWQEQVVSLSLTEETLKQHLDYCNVRKLNGFDSFKLEESYVQHN